MLAVGQMTGDQELGIDRLVVRAIGEGALAQPRP
jgi:hypothetical protein